MKTPQQFRTHTSILALAVLVAAPTAFAAGPYYWDGNDNTSGFGTAGGIWAAPTVGTTASGWSTDSTGATVVDGTSVTTTTSDAVNFGSPSLGLDAGTITVSDTVDCGDMTLDVASGNLILTEGTINFSAAPTIASGTGKFLRLYSTLAGAGTSCTFVGPGYLDLRSTNTGWGAGASFYHNAGTVNLYNSDDVLGGFTYYAGDTSGSAPAVWGLVTSQTITNDVVIRAGSSGAKQLQNRAGNVNSVWAGNFTVNDNFTVLHAQVAGRLTLNGTGTIAPDKLVTFRVGNTGVIADDAAWSGEGSTTYYSNSSDTDGGTFLISGQKTFAGGATVSSMKTKKNSSVAVVVSSSMGPANAPTSGPFGIGTLTMASGTGRIRADTAEDITIGNPLSFTGVMTFLNVANEKSLIFTGDVNMNGTGRQLNILVGASVPGKFVEFQGALTNSGVGGAITKTGSGMGVLSGINTYDGGTIISAGTLQFAKLVSMPAVGSVAGNAGTLAVNVGGPGEWTTGTSGEGTIGGLLAGLGGQSGSTVTWAGASLGLDTGNAGGAQTYSGIIADPAASSLGGMIKLGAGTLTLDQDNTYSGNTTINGGTLLVNNPTGSGTSSGAVTVNSGGTLSGNGIINGVVTVKPGGTLSPGASIGTITLNNYLSLSGNLAIEVDKSQAPGQTNDLIAGFAMVDGSGTVSVQNLGPALVPGDTFKIVSFPVTEGDKVSIETPGVVWANNLAVDGTIVVVSVSAVSAPGITGVGLLPDQNISLTATGYVGSAWSLRAVTDVAQPLPWPIIQSGTITANPLTVDDLTATNYPHRFYQFSNP